MDSDLAVGDTALKAGIGVVGFLTARADTANYTPFPGLLPGREPRIADFSVQAAYVLRW